MPPPGLFDDADYAYAAACDGMHIAKRCTPPRDTFIIIGARYTQSAHYYASAAPAARRLPAPLARSRLLCW